MNEALIRGWLYIERNDANKPTISPEMKAFRLRTVPPKPPCSSAEEVASSPVQRGHPHYFK